MLSMDFSQVKQVIGVGYTYRQSRPVRDRMGKSRSDHSSHHTDFTYFKKVNGPEEIVKDGERLHLTRHPITGESVKHWSESEVAIILSEQHTIVGYCLANDFTAFEIELQNLGEDYDPTYYGKCWPGSCSLGPKIFSAEKIRDDNNLEIGLRIERDGIEICDLTYNTRSQLRPFVELPELVVWYYTDLIARFGSYETLPQSKQIEITGGFLPSGTVILVGSGIIKLDSKYFAKSGDIVTIYCPLFGELRNRVE